MRKHHILGVGSAVCAIFIVGVIVFAQDKPAQEEGERKITEAEVPKAALEALKKLAGQAAITEFAEEIEHGHTFYEGSWNGPNGNVDAVVTPSGDLVVLEEIVPAGQVPAAVRTAGDKAADKDAKLTFEKKTMVLYEIHFANNGKGHDEMVFTPDARPFHEDAATKGNHDDDDDDKGAKKGDEDEDEDD